MPRDPILAAASLATAATTMAVASLRTQAGPGRPRAQAIDRHVGARVRERRVMLGLTQSQAAELIGVTYQQWHKYEKGLNRVAASRLSSVAQALGVEVGHFFAGLDGDARPLAPTPPQRLLLELARDFVALPSRKHQEALCHLARALANPERAAAPEAELLPAG